MSNDITARLTAMGIPVVNFNRGQDDARLTDITSDNIAGRAPRDRVPRSKAATAGSRISVFVGGGGGGGGGGVGGAGRLDRSRPGRGLFRRAMDAAGLEPFAMIDGMYARRHRRRRGAAAVRRTGPTRRDFPSATITWPSR